MLIANRYEPTGDMRWGGMSEVHTCVDHHLRRKVMLKRVKNVRDTGRLLDEQKALLSLRSSHVVELLDIVTYDYAGTSESGLILEFIEGSDLQEGSCELNRDYIFTLWQIASGLSDIHGSGVIHRDIKPSNIRRDAEGILKIIDFGLSRQIGIDDHTRSVAGSFGYMAPELGAAGGVSFTKAVDVYAFGMTALSLLKPIAQHGNTSPIAMVDEILTTADPEIKKLIRQCLSSNPSERPDSAYIKSVLASTLTYGQHRGLINVAGAITEINSAKPTASIKAGEHSLSVGYDGQSFRIVAFTGSVTVNNRAAQIDAPLDRSCLITFGTLNSVSRAFLTFDVVIPEVRA